MIDGTITAIVLNPTIDKRAKKHQDNFNTFKKKN